MARVCSGCGLYTCDGRCFTECAADYAESEETISTLTLDDCRKLYGEQLTETLSDPFLKRRKLSIVTKPRKEAA